MHAYAKEVESKAKVEKENRIDSLRNYYMDQLALLEEELNERARTSKMQDKVGRSPVQASLGWGVDARNEE